MRKLALVLVIAAGSIACGTSEKKEPLPLEIKEAALTATKNIEDNVLELEAVLAFLEGSKLLEDLLTDMGMGGQSCQAGMDPETGEFTEEECVQEKYEIKVEFEESVKEFTDWLNDYVLVDSQVEASDGSSVVYLLDPDIFCKGEESEQPPKVPEGFEDDESGNTDEPAPDEEYYEEEDSGEEECKDVLSKVQLRVKFVSYAEGDLDVDFLVGEEMYQAFHLELYKSVLAVEVDLAELQSAVETLFDATAEEGETLDFPEVFEGVVRVELRKLATGEYQLMYQIKEAVKVVVDADGNKFSVEVGPGTAKAIASKTDETVTIEVNAGSVTVKFPYQMMVDSMWEEEEECGDGTDDCSGYEEEGEIPDEEFPPEKQPADDISEEGQAPKVTGDVTLFIAGLTGSVELSDKTDSLTIKGLGLGSGTSYLKVKNDTVFSVDLNKNNGWRFDFTISMDGEDAVIKVSPVFDLAIGFGFKFIEKDMKEKMEGFGNEIFRVLLDSASEPTVKFTEEALEVLAGKLTLSSTAAPKETIVVDQGQCLIPPEDGEDEEEGDGPQGHAILSEFSAGACP